MTTDLAAALLRDVERWRPEHPGVMVPDPNGVWVDHRHVLAALSRALDPALTERVGEVVERLQKADEYEPLGHDGWDAADLITALRAERDEYKRLAAAGELAAQECRIWQGQAEAAEAREERLRGALRDIEADCDADYPPSHGAIKQAARAALSATTEERK